MANVKITGLTAITAPANTDVLPIVDVSADVTKKVSIADLLESAGDGTAALPAFAFDSDKDIGMYRVGANQLGFATAATARLIIDSSGNVLIGVASSFAASNADNLQIGDNTSSAQSGITLGSTTASSIRWRDGADAGIISYQHSDNSMRLSTSDTERLRIDSSGRLLVGTPSAPAGTDAQYTKFAIRGNTLNDNACYLSLGNKKTTANTSNDDNLGIITFNDSDSDAGEYARITGATDGNNGTNDYPGKLIFSTTSDGGSSPTERMRIDSSGNVAIGATSSTSKLRVIGNEIRFSNSSNASYYGTITHDAASTGANIYNNNDGTAVSHIWQHNGTEKMRIDSSGRLLLNGGTDVRIELGTTGTTATNDRNHIRGDGSSLKYNTCSGGTHVFEQNGTESLRIDSSANVRIGQTSGSSSKLSVYGSQLRFQGGSTGTGESDGFGIGNNGATDAFIWNYENGFIQIGTNNTERVKIHSTGYVNAGGFRDSNDLHRLNGYNVGQGGHFCTISAYQASGASTQDTALFYGVNSSGTVNSAAAGIKVYRNDTTLRSLNLAGTVNTSGNDYAEYMVKAGDFTIAKGDICGVNAQGKLTNVFADAVTFVVKSTDPSYVGGDAWDTSLGEEPGGYDDTRTGEELEAAKVAYQEQLEAVRQTVDRIAFSGQTPVNVTGTTPGQHIIPTANSNGSISGTAKSEADLTLAEYMSSVGKVIAIEKDGRAKIIVKVA